jgi:CheY-like chemotaxis protein
MNGFEAARQIRRLEKEHKDRVAQAGRKAPPSTYIAALTGLDSTKAQKEAYGSGIDTFLIKPLRRPQLQSILQQMRE